MNRAVASFLTFCVALVILFGAMAWWLGAPLLRLAFDAEQRVAPYHALYLVDAAPPGDPGAYESRFTELLAQESAQLLWQANEVVVPSGEVADEWDQVSAVRFASGSGFVRLVTGGNYRTLQAQAPGGRRSVLGLSDPPGTETPSAELLMVAAASPEGGSVDLVEAFAPALAAGGRIVWDSPVVVLEGNSQFDQLLVLGFDEAASVDEWLWSTVTETDLALLRSRMRNLTLWRLSALSR